MPCRALEAFGPYKYGAWARRHFEVSLNALSGIGGVRTDLCIILAISGDITSCLNALSGIGGVRTQPSARMEALPSTMSLNALSGIGGVRTDVGSLVVSVRD